MQDLIRCDRSLIVNIKSQYQDWSFVYDIVKSVSITMGAEPSSHPIPYGTEITDHLNRRMDTLTIEGVIGCYRCNGRNLNTTIVIPKLKEMSERLVYNRDDFFLLTSNDWQFRYAILTTADVKELQDEAQTKYITTVWQGANLTGTIRNPDFKRGGIVY